MLNYDFLNLSPNEFENISRDLLQKKLKIYIESFTTGKDGGIDFRYTTDDSKTIIIQSKRYKDYLSLYNQLKKETIKVNNLKPNEYILTTNVGLTPNNKKDIVKLFKPYIKKSENIFGKDDLNNLLGQYKEIENKYYKLWLASTNILYKIIHSKVYNQSIFELEKIKDQLRLYVQNDSFEKALNILEKNNYVIISGIPGIGKTTLAQVLILFLLSSKYEEFIFLPDTIDDAFTYYKDDVKQVFFFDDFLGRVRFDVNNVMNTENKIVNFIDKIRKTPDKILIFTTREYILNQARNTFEKFNIHNIEIAKCILDLSSYTKSIKAQILCNHLFFSKLPQQYLKNLIKDENYLKLVNHKNYNPRIIETVTNSKVWEKCKPNDFTNEFVAYFDNPQSVWKLAYENSLDKISQCALLVLLTLGTPVLIQDLLVALKEFILQSKYNIAIDSIIFNRAVKELENTFIVTKKDSEDDIVIEFQNPSIQDFLINYLKDKDDFITNLLHSSLFTNQFFNIFTGETNSNFTITKKISITESQIEIAIERIKVIYSKIQTSNVFRLVVGKTENFTWYRDNNFLYSFLLNVLNEMAPKDKSALNFVYAKFQELILLNSVSYREQAAYIELLSKLDLSKFIFDENELIQRFIDKIHWIDNFEIFTKLQNIFPTSYKTTINEESFTEKVTEIVQEEMNNVDNSDIYSLIQSINDIERIFSIDYDNEIRDLEKKEEEYNDYIENQEKDHFHEIQYSNELRGLTDSEENNIIGQMFNSLLND